MTRLLPVSLAAAVLLASCANPPDPGTGRPDPDLASPSTIAGVDNFAKVTDGVWRGAQPTAEGFATLKAMGVRTIVNLRALHSDRDLLRGLGLGYAHFPCTAVLPDEEVVLKFLRVATTPACRPVFVHCEHGADRTGVAIAAYRMAVQGWANAKAKRELPVFNFHDVFVPLERYLEGFDGDAARARVDAMPAVEIETVP